MLEIYKNGIKISSVLLMAIGMFAFLYVNASALSAEDISAETAVLIDAETGQVLFDKGMDERMHPASMTKIMTGLLVMESCGLDEIVTVTEEAISFPYEVSDIALVPGEELSVDSAMYAMMLPSANDAANALAEHVAGTQAEFAMLMTERSKRIGAMNTNFSNAHGLPDRLHYTTAYDMALITREAIKNSAFIKYFGTTRHTIPATNLQPEERPFTNLQYMLLPDMWVYNPDVIGGKVGYTEPSGHTMSTAATKDGRTLICVVMKCGVDEKFYDTQTLLDYGFDSFNPMSIPASKLSGFTIPVLESGINVGEASFSAEKSLHILAPLGINETDIRYQCNLPEFIENGDEPTASVTLYIPGAIADDLPELQMVIPLKMRITYNLPIPLEISDKTTEPLMGSNILDKIYIAVPTAILLLLFILWIKRRLRIYHRKKRRYTNGKARRNGGIQSYRRTPFV